MRAGILSVILSAIVLAITWMGIQYGFVPIRDTARTNASSTRYGVTDESVGPDMASSALIETTLRDEGAVRWPIVNGGHGIPPNGCLVLLSDHRTSEFATLPSSGIVHDGHVVVPAWPREIQYARAMIRGFGCALLEINEQATAAKPVSFRPSGSVFVTVRDTAGVPLSGVRVSLFERYTLGTAFMTRTDGQGRARISDLYNGPGARVECRLTGWGNLPISKRFRNIKLDEGDAVIEHVVPKVVTLTVSLDVTTNGHVPSRAFTELADVYAYRSEETKGTVEHALRKAHKLYRERLRSVGRSFPLETDVEQLERLRNVFDDFGGLDRILRARGGAVVQLRPDTDSVCTFKVRAFETADRLRVVVQHDQYMLPEPCDVALDGKRHVRARLGLATMGVVRVHVSLPDDEEHGLVLERWNVDNEEWEVWTGSEGLNRHPIRAERGKVATFWDVRAGRYRAADALSGKHSAPFQVNTVERPITVALDLSE